MEQKFSRALKGIRRWRDAYAAAEASYAGLGPLVARLPGQSAAEPPQAEPGQKKKRASEISPTSTAKKARLSSREADERVRQYLCRHKARAGKGEVSIRKISQETGVARSSVAACASWRALQDELEKRGRSRRPCRKKAASFTDRLHETAADPELQGLINEQESDYEPSPLSGARRAVRVRKKA
jgi:hypothetical protein